MTGHRSAAMDFKCLFAQRGPRRWPWIKAPNQIIGFALQVEVHPCNTAVNQWRKGVLSVILGRGIIVGNRSRVVTASSAPIIDRRSCSSPAVSSGEIGVWTPTKHRRYPILPPSAWSYSGFSLPLDNRPIDGGRTPIFGQKAAWMLMHPFFGRSINRV